MQNHYAGLAHNQRHGLLKDGRFNGGLTSDSFGTPFRLL